MSAIRMVAYGVLEYMPLPRSGNAEEFIAARDRNEEILGMVKEEFGRMGWLLIPETGMERRLFFRLMGKREPLPPAAWQVRQCIAERATLQEACLAAARWEDQQGLLPPD